MFQIGLLEILIILLVGILVIGPEQLPDFVKSSVKSFTKLQNKLFEFRASVERDIGAEDLKQDIFNELKMEELERDDEPPK
ncbi:MAG: Sec-independent protein translocase protein TatB [Gammaproteobacteria bacterium]|nr:Sec-independent protein translocase protein TatB [Gammaproteobacteria bacterium]MDA9131495.1 Sec-independent protein translocase protein TatB [Gammaproteobacteria bacterium]MDA9174984.1 Sec-independent protein translocase protein TatB [Gammaproteobacteria bacterium]MDA9834428.1 Sec-independent protein translocase protein TatB [Gammaproteobacteria bacterium]MDA9970934.1 Sec-independent protein translocase protein TatB [Gammaproteobacteria bacterium]